MKEITIKPLELHHAKPLSTLLLKQPHSYIQYFKPFSFEEKELYSHISEAKKDRYWGIFVKQALAGFFMLRGFDAGYNCPSYGIFVGHSYAGKGLGKLALYYVLSWCKLNQQPIMMLKVHPENSPAERIYKQAGFQLAGVCPNTKHHIYEIRW